ncbi:uncharacterized protein KY384_001905 [Bacidia gigantensis]|uniref:uncharacterized protein n=1 Tax=Bacidia gigantensis TaxID=2732470 RepID=UPI001D05A872|nr:uncharacterized protein KY384_001905 [Bacidia gigantensis]KAG8533122.1 hypothetical protein KY384_001905 [Bacidia gigantensis]
MSPTPVTVVTGFLGSGKTTLILNLIPQLPQSYKLALLKNEFGDLEIDSQLASSSAISGVRELLNGCICCNLVGQLGDALNTLRRDVSPDRIIVETSGSAFPATLAMEINRIGRETGAFVLDGVVVVIDVENWKGYDDTSYTAKMQARYTDLIVYNKWELVDERKFEDCRDRVGDLEVQIADVKSEKGIVDKELLLGLDSALARVDGESLINRDETNHQHAKDHQSEVELLTITLGAKSDHPQAVDIDKLEAFLSSAPKDEVYRIKGLMFVNRTPRLSDNLSSSKPEDSHQICKYVLNWAFSRWTFTPIETEASSPEKTPGARPIARLIMICARYEANKWKKLIEEKGGICPEDRDVMYDLEIKRLI